MQDYQLFNFVKIIKTNQPKGKLNQAKIVKQEIIILYSAREKNKYKRLAPSPKDISEIIRKNLNMKVTYTML